VEQIHRIVSDPGRLTRKWFDGVITSGTSDVEYVEIVGVIATIVSIDTFCRSIGVPPRGDEAGRQHYERAAHILAEGEAAEDEAIAQSSVPRSYFQRECRTRAQTSTVAATRATHRDRYDPVSLWSDGGLDKFSGTAANHI
jgi:hypothetical protein